MKLIGYDILEANIPIFKLISLYKTIFMTKFAAN